MSLSEYQETANDLFAPHQRTVVTTDPMEWYRSRKDENP